MTEELASVSADGAIILSPAGVLGDGCRLVPVRNSEQPAAAEGEIVEVDELRVERNEEGAAVAVLRLWRVRPMSPMEVLQSTDGRMPRLIEDMYTALATLAPDAYAALPVNGRDLHRQRIAARAAIAATHTPGPPISAC